MDSVLPTLSACVNLDFLDLIALWQDARSVAPTMVFVEMGSASVTKDSMVLLVSCLIARTIAMDAVCV